MIMKYDSSNAQLAGPPLKRIQRRLLESDSEAYLTRVEWHHLAGDIIGFYPKSDEERERVDRFIDHCITRAREKRRNALGITSKAAAWRYIEARLAKGNGENRGFGNLEIKYGRYGPFVPSFGAPDALYYFTDELEKEIINRFLN